MTSWKYCWNHKASSKTLYIVPCFFPCHFQVLQISGCGSRHSWDFVRKNLHSEARAASKIPWISLTPWKLRWSRSVIFGSVFLEGFLIVKNIQKLPEPFLVQMVLDCLAQVTVNSQPKVTKATVPVESLIRMKPWSWDSCFSCFWYTISPPFPASLQHKIPGTFLTAAHHDHRNSPNLATLNLRASGPMLPSITFYWDKFGYYESLGNKTKGWKVAEGCYSIVSLNMVHWNLTWRKTVQEKNVYLLVHGLGENWSW